MNMKLDISVNFLLSALPAWRQSLISQTSLSVGSWYLVQLKVLEKHAAFVEVVVCWYGACRQREICILIVHLSNTSYEPLELHMKFFVKIVYDIALHSINTSIALIMQV